MTKTIERERLRRGWSRQALADRIGTTGETVYRLERNRQRLTMDWLNKFAVAFEMQPSELTDDQNDTTGQKAASYPARSAETLMALDTVSAAILPGTNAADILTMEGDALASVGILNGDHLFIDKNAEPKTGDVVILEIFGATRIPQKLARIYDPPFLISYSLDKIQRKPILIESAQVKILGVVQAVMRLQIAQQ